MTHTVPHTDHSFAERPGLTCQACGQAFTADIWLIIDAAARPDLLARVRDGTIHRFACPNGHPGAVNAPLLIFRSAEAWPLLFSPAQGKTAEQDQAVIYPMLARLAVRLGSLWRMEWLARVANIPREVLSVVLAIGFEGYQVGLHVPLQFREDVQRAGTAVERYLGTSDRAALDEGVATWEYSQNKVMNVILRNRKIALRSMMS